jgi:hypothetical protein
VIYFEKSVEFVIMCFVQEEEEKNDLCECGFGSDSFNRCLGGAI